MTAMAIERPLLDDVLTSTSRHVLVHAPHGFGKTVSVARWARGELTRGQVIIWVSAAVVDPARGGGEGGVRDVVGRVLDQVRYVLRSTTAAELDRGGPRELGALLRALGPVTLVVDEIHSGREELISGVLAAAAEIGARVVVLSTARPSAAVRDGSLVEVGASALAWSAHETVRFAQSKGAELTEQVAEVIADGLAGFPAAIVMAVAALGSGGYRQDLQQEVLAVVRREMTRALRSFVPVELMPFLFDTCVEPFFRADDLVELTATPDAREAARRLVEGGVLHEHVGGAVGVLEYEPRMRRSLLSHLHYLDPVGYVRRFQRRVDAHVARGDMWEALLRALDSREPGVVDRVLVMAWTDLLAGGPGPGFDELWNHAVERSPESISGRLRILRVAVRPTRGRVELLTEHDEQSGDTLSAATASPDAQALDAFCRAALLRRAGLYEKSVRVAQGALRELRADEDGQRLPRTAVAMALLEMQASMSALCAGMGHAAATYAESALQRSSRAGALSVAAAACELMAVVEATGGDLVAAQEWVHESRSLLAPPAWWRESAGDVSLIIGALVHLEGHRLEEAKPTLGRNIMTPTGDFWFLRKHVVAVMAELRGAPDLALDVLLAEAARRGLGIEPDPSERRAPFLVVHDVARLHLAAGRGAAAIRVIDTLPRSAPVRDVVNAHALASSGKPAEAFRHVAKFAGHRRLQTRTRIEGVAVAASALIAMGQKEQARAEMRRALGLARRANAMLELRWASSEALNLLLLELEGEERTAVEQVAQLGCRTSSEDEMILLPERQLLVLQLIVDGLSGPEIARRLYVSHNTVKSQIREIYRRLGTHTRAETLLRAKQLGLVSSAQSAPRRAQGAAPSGTGRTS